LIDLLLKIFFFSPLLREISISFFKTFSFLEKKNIPHPTIMISKKIKTIDIIFLKDIFSLIAVKYLDIDYLYSVLYHYFLSVWYQIL